MKIELDCEGVGGVPNIQQCPQAFYNTAKEVMQFNSG